MGEDTLISFKNVKKSFGKKQVLKDISFEINEGEIFGIIGESGAGKTTILNLLIGFLPFDNGEIYFNVRGEYEDPKNKVCIIKRKTIPLSESVSLVRKEFGFSTQSPSFYNKLSVYENLDYFGSIYGVKKSEREKRIKELLELFELNESAKSLASDLSGGMQKRLDIACALIHNPYVLILDEPTADLDPILRREIWELLKKINKTGTTIIIASHFVNELEAVCNKVVILNNGYVVKEDTPNTLIDNYIRYFEVRIETREAKYKGIIENILKNSLLKIRKIKQENKKLVIYTEKPQLTITHVLKLINVSKQKLVEAAIERPTLSEVFESLVKKEK